MSMLRQQDTPGGTGATQPSLRQTFIVGLHASQPAPCPCTCERSPGMQIWAFQALLWPPQLAAPTSLPYKYP